jgi:tetratricopeptide (TPR) repeat protein
VRRRAEGAIVAGLIALSFAWAAAPSAHAELDSGVIRLAQPTAAETEPKETPEPEVHTEARHGFDVEAFDSRFESLWFQRKAYQAEGRDDDVARQSDLIRDFVAEEGVRRLEAPAAALLVEARAWLREGNYGKALGALSLADALDPGRPQIRLARAHVLFASGAGILPAAVEWLHAARGAVTIAFRDLSLVNGTALVAVVAMLLSVALFALFIAFRYHTALRHDVEELFVRHNRETVASAAGWAVLLLPFLLWIPAGWIAVYWIVVFFRYMRRNERALAALLLLLTALALPAYRFAIGLYGLTADPSVRITIAAANGGYDPDRIVKLRQLVEVHSDDPMYRFLLAGLYKNGRYYEDAFQEYKRVLDAAPSTYQARINLGNIYFAIGQYGEAITNYRRALDIRPDSVLAYYDMYLAQSDSFKLKEASESLASARRIDPVMTNRLLSIGSREGTGAKVIDAVIDFDSIWRASVEGRHLSEWLNGAPERAALASALPGLANVTSIVALAALLSCGIVLVFFRGIAPAKQCLRCGRPFCAECKPGRDGHDYCSQCVHLFVLGDGLAPETKSMKLYEVERHDAWGRRIRRIASALLPGAAHILTGRAWIGCGLLTLWLLAWLGGFPSGVTALERLLGTGMHLGEMRPGAVPDAYGVDAVALLAIPLGVVVWLVANAGFRRLRRA